MNDFYSLNEWENTFDISQENLTNGVYYLQIKTISGSIFNFKLINIK